MSRHFWWFIWLWLMMPAMVHGLSVAIIGSGIGGAALAYFLKEHAPEVPQITVYEKAGRIGGRVHSVHFTKDVQSEVGASVYHIVNRYIRSFVEKFNLSTSQPYLGGRMALFAGKGQGSGRDAFEFETSDYQVITFMKMFWRYGFAMRHMKTITEDAITNFTKLYDIVESSEYFTDVKEALDRIGLSTVAHQTLAQHLKAGGIPSRLIDEFITGCTRVNYGQSPYHMNAFAGLVALKGSGKQLYSVREGNAVLLSKLLEYSGAEIRLGQQVSEIRQSSNQWEVFTADGTSQPYDIVVICTPLTDSGITLPDSVTQKWTHDALGPPMWTTHATFIQGNLQPQYFGKEPDDEMPTIILTTDNERLPFSSIGRTPHQLCPLDRNTTAHCTPRPIYKIFSRQPLAPEVTDSLFDDVSYRHSIPWKAYPELKPRDQFPPVVLSHGLYYPNSFEFAVSTMETQAIAVRNVVNLICKDFKSECRSPKGAAGHPHGHDEL